MYDKWPADYCTQYVAFNCKKINFYVLTIIIGSNIIEISQNTAVMIFSY